MGRREGVTTTGVGAVRVTPDIARVSIGVSVRGQDAAEARTSAASAMAAVLGALKAQGIGDADLRTGRLSLSAEYDYKDGEQKRRGFRATNELLLTVRDIANAGAVVDAGVAAGGDASVVHDITFDVVDAKPLQRQALEAAYLDAHTRAEALAAAAGVTLGTPFRIEEQAAEPLHRPGGRMALMTEATPTPIEAGEQEVTARVLVTWNIA